MKKINISYLTNNKKIFNKVKLIYVGLAAVCMFTACSNEESKTNNSKLEIGTDIILEDEQLEVNSVEDIQVIDWSEKLSKPFPDLNNRQISSGKKVDCLCLKKEETNLESETLSKEDEKIINILDIKLSNSHVSTYNTDFELSDELKKEINEYIKGFGASCSFLAVNLNDGMAFGYNIDATYQTASTIKAPVCLYAFREMDKGNGSLEELKVYEERFRRDGSGVLKNQKSGTSYSLKDLFYYTINYSDNVAYYMIHDRFYNKGYDEYLKELGCNNLYLHGGKWGFIDARSAAIIWKEIYKYKEETENGKYLFKLFTNAEFNYIKEGMENYDSAHKSGWTPRETHDTAIVFAHDDYIVVILNNNNGNYSAKGQLLKISGCIEKGINEYQLYKEQRNNNKSIKKHVINK